MKNLSILILFVGLFLVSACQKDNFEPQFEAQKKSCQILKIEDNPFTPSQFFYDQNQRLIRSITLKDDLIRSEYQYDENGNMVRINDFYSDGTSAGYKEYLYNSKGALQRINHYLPDLFEINVVKFHHYETFFYNRNNQLTRKEYWHYHGKPFIEIDNYQEFEYDKNGNVSIHKYFTHRAGSTTTEMVLSITGSFEYDNSPNPMPFYALPPTSLEELSKNNLLKATYISPLGRIYAEGSFEAKYEYNAQNFPLKVQYIFANQTQNTKKFEYICF